jgi:hypothetical protein
MMENKKAWLRIVEATIGVLLLASVLFIMVVRIPRGDSGDNIYDVQRFALEQVSKNDTLREEILDSTILDKVKTNRTIGNIISHQWAYLDYNFRVCGVEEVCGMVDYPDKEVYADEILISSNLTKYSPKKLRLFVWRK